MKWVEIITLRSPATISTQFVDELLKQVVSSETPEHLIEIGIYHHSVVETDLSIHIYWKSEPGEQHKSPLGLKFSHALKNLGLVSHSVWVETAALKIPPGPEMSKPPDIPARGTNSNAVQTGPRITGRKGF